MTLEEIKQCIPHREPFLFLDAVSELEPGRRIVATKRFGPDEGFFAGHFPGNPVVPGVVLVEALAQAGAVLVCVSESDALAGGEPALVALEGVRFRRPVRPGEEVELVVELTRRRSRLWKMQGVAYVGDERAVEAEITATLFAGGGA